MPEPVEHFESTRYDGATLNSQRSLGDRLLGMAADGPGGRDPAVRLETLGTVLLVHASVETWFALVELDTRATGIVVLAAIYTALLALGLMPRFRRLALGAAAAVTLAQIVWTFPFVANHTFLRLFALGLLALPVPGSLAERRLAHAALGWLTAIVLFYTGFQKLVHGTYFQGQYLGYMVSLTDRFGGVFQGLLPAQEFIRLKGIGTPVPGAGPYAVDGIVFVVLSNLVYLVEMALGVALLWRRTRVAAISLILAMIVLIELGARELFFGVLFCNLVLVMHPRDLGRALLPVSIGLYVLALLLMAFGWGGTLS